MVDFAAFGAFFLLPRCVVVCLKMLFGRSGISKSGIGVGRIVCIAGHGGREWSVEPRQSHPTLYLLTLSNCVTHLRNFTNGIIQAMKGRITLVV